MAGQNDNSRVQTLFEKGAVYLLGAVLSLVIWSFQEQIKRVEELESKVILIDKVKVDKTDLRELEERINKKIEGVQFTLISRQEMSENNILSRLDFYIRQSKDK